MKANAHVASAFVIVVLTIVEAFAETAVNCDDVMRHLKAGSSPRDLADTTSISIDEVEACQHKADVEAADSMLDREESDESRKPLWRDESK
jgi:hypothetical protein